MHHARSRSRPHRHARPHRPAKSRPPRPPRGRYGRPPPREERRHGGGHEARGRLLATTASPGRPRPWPGAHVTLADRTLDHVTLAGGRGRACGMLQLHAALLLLLHHGQRHLHTCLCVSVWGAR